jgi:hypothetical protein
MSQISAGTANVTNGNNTVQLPGTDLTGVMSGHAFHIRGIDAVYSIIAAAPAASPPTVTLSVNYAGITATGVEYRITTGFSPNNSLYEPDAGDVDIPMLLKHRLVRPIDGGLNLFGSSARTILNYPGSDDNARMMNMLADTGNILLPAGYTAVVDPITVYASNHKKCAVAGLGGPATIKLKDGSNADLLTFDGTNQSYDISSVEGSYFRLDNIVLHGNKENQTGGVACLKLRNASYSVVTKSVIYKGYGDGIWIENYNGSPDSDEINIENSMIFFNGQNGVRLQYTYVTSSQAPGDHLIANNHINYNGLHGIYCPVGLATIISNNNILTNGFSGGPGCGIRLGDFTANGSWAKASRFSVIGNQVRYNNNQGLYADGINSSIISANQFHLNNRNTGGSNLDIWNAVDLAVTGNVCTDIDFTPINLYGAQFANSSGLMITGNIFNGLSGGVNMASSTYRSSCNVGLADA